MAKRSQRRQRFQDQPDTQVVSLSTERIKRSRKEKIQQHSDKRPVPSLEYRTEAQYHYGDAINRHTLTFGLGPAGTGKSWVPAAKAAIKLLNGEIEKIIVTRPMVSGDETDIGAVPGDVNDKFAPWFAPIRQILDKYLGKGAVDCHIKNGNIVVLPLQFMRGWTFSDCMVLADECQNASRHQIELLLTRIGENCTMVITGDEDQTDLKGANGLTDAVKRLKGLKDVAFSRFTVHDVVRSALVKSIISRYHPTRHSLKIDPPDEEE